MTREVLCFSDLGRSINLWHKGPPGLKSCVNICSDLDQESERRAPRRRFSDELRSVGSRLYTEIRVTIISQTSLALNAKVFTPFVKP